jgi:hypothetical protein
VVTGRLVLERPVPDGELGHDLVIGVVAAEAEQLRRAEGRLVELDSRPAPSDRKLGLDARTQPRALSHETPAWQPAQSACAAALTAG